MLRATQHGLHTWVFDHREYADRDQFDDVLQHYLEAGIADPDATNNASLEDAQKRIAHEIRELMETLRGEGAP